MKAFFEDKPIILYGEVEKMGKLFCFSSKLNLESVGRNAPHDLVGNYKRLLWGLRLVLIVWLFSLSYSFWATAQGFAILNFGLWSWILALASQSLTIIFVIMSYCYEKGLKYFYIMGLLLILCVAGHLTSVSGSILYNANQVEQVDGTQSSSEEHRLLSEGKAALRHNTQGYINHLKYLKTYYSEKVNSSLNGTGPTSSPVQGNRAKLFRNIQAALNELIVAGENEINELKPLNATLTSNSYASFYSNLEEIPVSFLHKASNYHSIEGAMVDVDLLRKEKPLFDFDAGEKVITPVEGRKIIVDEVAKYPFISITEKFCPPPSSAHHLNKFGKLFSLISSPETVSSLKGIDIFGIAIALLVELLTFTFNLQINSMRNKLKTVSRIKNRTMLVDGAQEAVYQVATSCVGLDCDISSPRDSYAISLLSAAVRIMEFYASPGDCIQATSLGSITPHSEDNAEVIYYKFQTDTLFSQKSEELSFKDVRSEIDKAVLRLIRTVIDHMRITKEYFEVEGQAYVCLTYIKYWLAYAKRNVGDRGQYKAEVELKTNKTAANDFVGAISKIVQNYEVSVMQ